MYVTVAIASYYCTDGSGNDRTACNATAVLRQQIKSIHRGGADAPMFSSLCCLDILCLSYPACNQITQEVS